MRLLAATRAGIAAVGEGRAEIVWHGDVRRLARAGDVCSPARKPPA